MRSIEDFLNEKSSLVSEKGQNGVFSEWLPCFQMEILGTSLQFVETRVLGLRGNENAECIEIQVNPGVFNIECKGVRFGEDARIAGLRVYPKGQSVLRESKIGEIPVDMGGISVADIATIEMSIKKNTEIYEEWLEEILYGENRSLINVHIWEPTQTRIPCVDGGFGDGLYSVYELKSNGATVGLEIKFISEGEIYPY